MLFSLVFIRHKTCFAFLQPVGLTFTNTTPLFNKLHAVQKLYYNVLLLLSKIV